MILKEVPKMIARLYVMKACRQSKISLLQMDQGRDFKLKCNRKELLKSPKQYFQFASVPNLMNKGST